MYVHTCLCVCVRVHVCQFSLQLGKQAQERRVFPQLQSQVF